MPAQVAGVALLTDYVLTVAVSVAAGTAALVSAFPALKPFTVLISVAFICLISFGNLRGVRESGRIFAVPTYFFIFNMFVLLGWGITSMVRGTLPTADPTQHGALGLGSAGSGLLMGATLYVVLHAFASGGAAVTGVEAISNGVPAFRKPEWKNARSTLVVMGTLLGAMFLGLSVLAAHMKVVPFAAGTPTVISQIGDLVYGPSTLGRVLFYALQAGTMLILVLAANTSFADFPRLASFHAGDNFMPRQLTKRGHRLVFSNGIIFLSVFSIILVVVTGAKVDRLIPLYAIGVFTSFTLSQAGMAKHHLRTREPGWRRGLLINGIGAFLSLVVDLIIAVTKFTHGAWLVILLVPIMVVFLARLAKQYATEAEQLHADVPKAVAAPIFQRHVVLVFVDRIDLASVRAIQYARTLMPDELRAVHFVLDEHEADALTSAWIELGMAQIELDLVDCADRRITRAAVEATARDLADGQTEVSVLLPERKYPGVWHRILHDQTADAIVRAVSRMPHANVTTVPFHFDQRVRGRHGEAPRSIVTPRRAPRAASTDDTFARLHCRTAGVGRHAHRRGRAAPAGHRAGSGPDVAGPAARGDIDARVRHRRRHRRAVDRVPGAGPHRRHQGRDMDAGHRHRGRPPRPARDLEPGLRLELRRRRAAPMTPDELTLAWADRVRPRPHPRMDGAGGLRCRVRTRREPARARAGRRVGPPDGARGRACAGDPGAGAARAARRRQRPRDWRAAACLATRPRPVPAEVRGERRGRPRDDCAGGATRTGQRLRGGGRDRGAPRAPRSPRAVAARPHRQPHRSRREPDPGNDHRFGRRSRTSTVGGSARCAGLEFRRRDGSPSRCSRRLRSRPRSFRCATTRRA